MATLPAAEIRALLARSDHEASLTARLRALTPENEEEAQALAEGCRSRRLPLVLACCEALGRSPSHLAAQEALLDLLRHAMPVVRAEAARGLARWRGPQPVPAKPVVKAFWLEPDPPAFKELARLLRGLPLGPGLTGHVLRFLELARTEPELRLPLHQPASPAGGPAAVPRPASPGGARGGIVGWLQRMASRPPEVKRAPSRVVVCTRCRGPLEDRQGELEDCFGVIAEILPCLVGSAASDEDIIGAMSALLELRISPEETSCQAMRVWARREGRPERLLQRFRAWFHGPHPPALVQRLALTAASVNREAYLDELWRLVAEAGWEPDPGWSAYLASSLPTEKAEPAPLPAEAVSSTVSRRPPRLIGEVVVPELFSNAFDPTQHPWRGYLARCSAAHSGDFLYLVAPPEVHLFRPGRPPVSCDLPEGAAQGVRPVWVGPQGELICSLGLHGRVQLCWLYPDNGWTQGQAAVDSRGLRQANWREGPAPGQYSWSDSQGEAYQIDLGTGRIVAVPAESVESWADIPGGAASSQDLRDAVEDWHPVKGELISPSTGLTLPGEPLWTWVTLQGPTDGPAVGLQAFPDRRLVAYGWAAPQAV